jgi:shikimate dehydrogenase
MQDAEIKWDLGLVGAGIQKSLSPALHETEARLLGLGERLHYRLIDLDILKRGPSEIGAILDAARLLGFAGLNLTHPVKQTVLPYLDSLSEDARAIGAVNTVVFDETGAVGHNTDWFGFAELEKIALDGERNEHVVQIGAGGAGSAAAYGQLKSGVRHIDLLDVDFDRASEVADLMNSQFAGRPVTAKNLADLADVLDGADGIVNATPVGMAFLPGSPVPAELLRESLWVIDVIYAPSVTQLVSDARKVGARATNGAGMTAFQATEAFRLFTGITPDSDRMLATMNSLIGE